MAGGVVRLKLIAPDPSAAAGTDSETSKVPLTAGTVTALLPCVTRIEATELAARPSALKTPGPLS